MITRQVLRDITSVMSRMQKTQSQISSGKKIEKPSDDPVGITQMLAYKTDSAQAQQYSSGITSCLDWLNSTSTTLTSVEDNMLLIIDVANQANTGLLSLQDRSALAEQVNQYLEEAYSLANAKAEGKSLFGGTQTLIEPFTATRDPATGRITSVAVTSPANIDNEMLRTIDKEQTIQVNSKGGELFVPGAGGNIFDNIIALRDALEDPDFDSAAVSGVITSLESIFNRVVNENAIVGAKINRLESTQERIKLESLSLTERISDIADTDIAKAFLEYQTQKNIYDASLSVGSQLIQRSLVNYL
jgi:flagellar hook-associated protein 3 FlgL